MEGNPMSASNAGRIGVWGASGSGKSTCVKRKIKTLKRLVIFDPLDEYSTLAGVTRVSTVDQVRQAMLADWRGFRVAYVPPTGKEPRALSQLCKLLMQAQEGFKTAGRGAGITLVIEEMNLSFPVAGGAQKSVGFAEVCSRGRHYGIEVYGLSQRIAEVSTRFRGNCTETIVLRQQGPRDVQAASDALGIDRDRVRGLKNFEYLHGCNGEIRAGKIKLG